MPKIKLGNRPKNFLRIVDYTLLDGSKDRLQVTFIYRSRVEFSEWIDSMTKAAAATEKARAEAAPAPTNEDLTHSSGDFATKVIGANAEYLLGCLESWELEDPITLESLRELCDLYPSCAQALMDGYRVGCTEGRAKN